MNAPLLVAPHLAPLLAAGTGRPFGVAFALIGAAAVIVLVGLVALTGGRRQEQRNHRHAPSERARPDDRNEDS